MNIFDSVMVLDNRTKNYTANTANPIIARSRSEGESDNVGSLGFTLLKGK
jgi:hypothetical protein